jgi:valyl-tRNA synthetase
MAAHELPKTYEFKGLEERIYALWEQNGYFKPINDPNKAGHDPSIKPFVISIPPPNVTGELHLGHALFVSMEDLMIRYHRMKGVPTLWVPGSDHAGIATQLQVEKDILRTEEVTREELGREEFLKRTWEWKEKYGGIITRQIRRLGASCDWERERFTLDDGLSKAVAEAFVHLYEKGLIYRGPRLINWSPGLKTAVSDLEVEYHEEEGKLYFFKYRLKDSDDFIPVATTRPETILGDTGVAVHPNDERYQAFIGKTVIVPMLNREVPVIADEYVDLEFGTGALKVTPGHDPNDYAIGERHSLPILSVLDREAQVNEHGGPYAGMDRFAAREKLWADMQAAGLTIKTETRMHQVPRSQRGGEIVEPMISTQWFVTMDKLGQAALDAVENGDIQIVPAHFTKVYTHWMENLQDWCISRQLWWGHRIPVWYGPDGAMFCARDEAAAYEQAKAHYKDDDIVLEQDPDVLDTWFSSGLWPFSTLGWPQQTPDLGYFYPTSVLETGYDILFFWVARMIISGLEYTGEIPFHTVYLHGIIRDEQGRKMSKTLGNVIDPLVVMDEMGTDALRFTLLVGSTPGKDMNLSVKKVQANRNFANKVWNAGRLVLNLLAQAPDAPVGEPLWTLADGWIFARTRQVVRDVERLFQNYQYGEAGRQIYEFFWSEYADWYLEIAKLQMTGGGDRAHFTARALLHVMDTCLRLLHPFTPYITEELWGHLKAAAQTKGASFAPQNGWEPALIVANWPQAPADTTGEAEAIHEFELVMEIVRAIRNLRAEKAVKPGVKLPAMLSSAAHQNMLAAQAYAIAGLAGLDPERVTIHAELSDKPEGHVALVAGPVEIYLPLAELVDPGEERARLSKDRAAAQSHIDRLEKLLAGPFAQNAPQDVVDKERQKLAEYQETVARIDAQLSALE